MARDEGVIKFNCIRHPGVPFYEDQLRELMEIRTELFDLELIGIYPDGIGFGNVSQRWNRTEFVITGSATGSIPVLTPEHFSLVIEASPAKNQVTCVGSVKASSESLTHALIYRFKPFVGAIIHTHHKGMWEFFMGEVPTTPAEVPYGTPAMCDAVKQLFEETDVEEQKFFVMAGHEDGVIAFGEDLPSAFAEIEARLAQATGL